RATTERTRAIKLKQSVESIDLARRECSGATGGTRSECRAAREIDLVLSVVEAPATAVANVKAVARLQLR
ncbi:MAG TPA: hypothetical protein VNV64_06550, partial [Candidatus Binatia bacterium]|nr:hypothetical protein [Candidatus Binatia bacterium]